MTKKEKKQMEKQAEALKKARGKATKVVKKKLDSNFNDLSNSVDVINEEIIIDFGTSKSPTMIKPIEDNGEFNYIILPIKSREN